MSLNKFFVHNELPSEMFAGYFSGCDPNSIVPPFHLYTDILFVICEKSKWWCGGDFPNEILYLAGCEHLVYMADGANSFMWVSASSVISNVRIWKFFQK